MYNIPQQSISFFTDAHKTIKKIQLSDLDFDSELSYFPLLQNEITNLAGASQILTEQINYANLSPSLSNLGFDNTVARDLSFHKFLQDQKHLLFSQTNIFIFKLQFL